MKHTIKKLRAGDYVYRGHRITDADTIYEQDNLTCEYDWEPMWSSHNGGGYFGWYISVEPFVKTNELDSIIGKDKWPPEYYNVGCKYEHESDSLKGAKRMIDNHLDKTDEIEKRLGFDGKLLTGAELKIWQSAHTEAAEVKRLKEYEEAKHDHYAEIYGSIFNVITTDAANGSWSFHETTEAVIEALKDKRLLSTFYNGINV